MVLVITAISMCVSGTLPSQYILLNKSAELTDYIGQYTEALSGKTFLVVDMAIENHGYDSVEINPNYFGVVIDNVAYPYDKATYSTDSPLSSLALLDGGKTSGKLAFQIPEGKTNYVLVFAGQNAENVIYGELAHPDAQEEAEPEKPTRNVTCKVNGETQTLIAYGESTPNPEYITQEVIYEWDKSESEPSKFIEVQIKTVFDESLKPIDKPKAIQESIDSYMVDVKRLNGGANIDEKPTYEATLSNGDEVVVHPFRKIAFTRNGDLYVSSYVLDDDTIVLVASSEDKQAFDEILKTLKIGELNNSPI